jgi:uncharacterized protein YycO
MVTIYLSASNTVGSYLIRFFTWSRWSHVFIADGDDAIEAHWRHGVRRKPLKSLLEDVSRYAKVEVSTGADEAVLEAVRAQIGKPYDYSAILGFLFRRDWQKETAWECAELVAFGFDRAGKPVFRSEDMSRITPGDWWNIHPVRLAS